MHIIAGHRDGQQACWSRHPTHASARPPSLAYIPELYSSSRDSPCRRLWLVSDPLVLRLRCPLEGQEVVVYPMGWLEAGWAGPR